MSDLPWKHVSENVRLAEADLEACRSFIARLVSIRDALLASAVTASGGLLALTLSSHQALVGFCGGLVIALLSALEAANHLTFTRVRANARSLELLLDSYATALREQGTAAERSKQMFTSRLNRYRFGSEGALRSFKGKDWRKATVSRLRWWTFPLLTVSLVTAGFTTLGTAASNEETCVVQAPGTTVRLKSLPEVKKGALTIVSCEP